jgi:hypothetical protein
MFPLCTGILLARQTTTVPVPEVRVARDGQETVCSDLEGSSNAAMAMSLSSDSFYGSAVSGLLG